MNALTIKQFWLYAITDLGKRIENRTWVPPEWAVGERLALHSSLTVDMASAVEIQNRSGQRLRAPVDAPRGCIVATAVLIDFITPASPEKVPEGQDVWFDGPVGWVLDDVVKLPKALPCKGQLGLWKVDSDLTAEIERIHAHRNN